ncbi:MAG: hypothetical protein MJ169_01210 [Treponema sp.]|nr:hypothetical protein [Treponema sp.]
MAKKSISLGRLILQIALGCMLAIGGVWALMGGGDFGASAIKEVFNGNVEKILVIAFGVIELLAGIFLLLELFLGDIFGKLDSLFVFIIIIVWIVAIVLSDFFGKGGILHGAAFLPWLYSFASHLVVLGGLFAIKD